MKKFFTGIGIVLLLITACEFNHAPTILKIVVTPLEVGTGDTLYLSCDASDSDNDVLTYIWTIGTATVNSKSKDTSYVVNLNQGEYKVWCRVEDEKGAYDESDTITIKVVASGPSPVNLIGAIDTSDTKVTLVWTQSDAEDFLKYEVHFSPQSGFTPSSTTKAADIRSKTDTTYEVTGLSPSTDYYFKVLVYNTKEKYSESNELHVTTKPVPPTPVTLREAYDITTTSLKLSWTPNQDEDFNYYEIHRSLTPDFTPSTATKIDQTSPLARNDTLYDVTGLTPNTEYYFKIVVVNQGGARSSSNEIKAKTLNYEIVGRCDLRNGHPREMIYFGNYIYVAATEGGVVSISVSDPTSPLALGGYSVGFYPAYDLHNDGTYLYVAMADTGLHILNAQINNVNPQLTSILDTSCIVSGGGAPTPDTCHIGGSPLSVFKTGDRVILGIKSAGVYWLKLANVANPAQPGDTVTAGSACSACASLRVQLPDEPRDIAVYSNYAYIACAGAGLVIVDIGGTSPSIVGQITFSGDANAVYISGDKAYVAAGKNGLVILDISTPTSPTKIYELKDSESDAWDIYVSTPRAYLADGTSGVRIINISDPYSPFEEHHLRVGTDIRAIWARNISTGNYIYAGDWENRFLVVKWQ